MNYICAFLECATIFTISVGLERERKKAGFTRILVCIAFYMLYYVLINQLFDVSVQSSLIGYVIIYLSVKWLYKESMIHSLVVTVLSAVFAALIEYVLAFFVALTVTDTKETGLYMLIVTGLTFVLSVTLSRIRLHRLLVILEKKDYIYAIVCILSLMIFTPALALRIIRQLYVVDYIYIVVCVVIMWLLIGRVQKYKLESKIRRQYFEAYKEVIIQIRRRQHKIKNQINSALGMIRICTTYEELVEKQSEYLGKILDYELPNDAIILEEPSIIALIYEKINKAAECGIEINTSFSCSMVGSRVSDIIWVDLIGTFFDNAIEALINYDGPKKIWLNIGYEDEEKIRIRIINTFRRLTFEETYKFFQMGYSTKGDGRGVGLYNARMVVDKNNGELRVVSTMYEGESVFWIEIIL